MQALDEIWSVHFFVCASELQFSEKRTLKIQLKANKKTFICAVFVGKGSWINITLVYIVPYRRPWWQGNYITRSHTIKCWNNWKKNLVIFRSNISSYFLEIKKNSCYFSSAANNEWFIELCLLFFSPCDCQCPKKFWPINSCQAAGTNR